MTIIFADSSAVAKRYILEVGSSWVESWIKPAAGNVIIISVLTSVEIFSFLARRHREGAILYSSWMFLQKDFLLHAEKQYLTISLDSDVLTEARNLINKHSLRALDGIQLACALKAVELAGEAVTFISADEKLLLAAINEKIAVENPNSHP